MADADAIDASIVAASAKNVRDTAPNADESYIREWRRLIFVDSKCGSGELPPGDKYLTRNNVDIYFTTICFSSP